MEINEAKRRMKYKNQRFQRLRKFYEIQTSMCLHGFGSVSK